MAPNESVVIATLEINGVNIEDFNSVTVGGYTKGVQVELMHKTNFGRITERHTIQINFPEPVDGFPVEIENIRNGLITLGYDGGKRITYSGVNTMEVGEGNINMTEALSTAVTYSASDRTVE